MDISDTFEKRLSALLASRERRVVPAGGLKRAAVLIPIFHKDGRHHLLLTKRTEWLRDHKGQICFPGGGYHDEDGTLLATALRESVEEIGLMPGDVRLLGALDDEQTWVSGYVITPYLGIIPYPYGFKVSSYEIQELVEVPVSALIAEGACRQDPENVQGRTPGGYYFDYEGKIIWGATARILRKLVAILREVAGRGEGLIEI